MNPAALLAYLKAHQVVALGGAGGVVALIAWRKKTAAGAAATDPAAAAAAAAQGAPYDSSASDAYNALQPQIGALADAVSALQNPAPGTTPVPVAASGATSPPRVMPLPSIGPGGHNFPGGGTVPGGGTASGPTFPGGVAAGGPPRGPGAPVLLAGRRGFPLTG